MVGWQTYDIWTSTTRNDGRLTDRPRGDRSRGSTDRWHQDIEGVSNGGFYEVIGSPIQRGGIGQSMEGDSPVHWGDSTVQRCYTKWSLNRCFFCAHAIDLATRMCFAWFRPTHSCLRNRFFCISNCFMFISLVQDGVLWAHIDGSLVYDVVVLDHKWNSLNAHIILSTVIKAELVWF